jgi:TatD DNase family protein
MLIDTHCHLNMIIKNDFDRDLTEKEIELAKLYIDDAYKNGVKRIINVGTSLIESLNCIKLAQKYPHVYATIGIHPNDLKDNWKNDLKEIKKLLKDREEYKIVGIGECGLDFHYPDYNIKKQKDAFKEQIELSLENDIALIVHTRQAPQETLDILSEFKGQIKKGIIHCFSENLDFAKEVIKMKFAIGLGGTITYPKNEHLREVAKSINLSDIVLETDAPFLAPQTIRGQQNTPKEILTIANFLAELRKQNLEDIQKETTKRANIIFNLGI